tara:strand:+ start:950 stop:1261 length:312 start_codon:yes stop_codon:yes gene_type:complete
MDKYIKDPTIDVVKRLLTNHPHLRDSDNKLLANVWFQSVIPLEEAWMDFLALIASGDLPSSESIRRCRQKLQELNPELRGELWDKRHQMQEQVKEELKEMEND